MTLDPRGFGFDMHCVRSQRAPQWIVDLDQATLGQRVQETRRGGRRELIVRVWTGVPPYLAVGGAGCEPGTASCQVIRTR